MTLVRFTGPIVLFILCLLPPLAFAQTDAKVEARLHFDRGLALTKQGGYAEAVTEFNRAYELSPHFAVLYNLGQAYSLLGQPVYAVQALGRYLSEGGKEVPAQRRKQVEADMAREERHISAVTLRSEIVGAVIQVDGIEVGRSPMPTPVRVNAGVHVFSAFAPGYRPWEQRLVLPGMDQRLVDIHFEALSPPTTAVSPAASPPGAAPVAVLPSPVTASVPTLVAPATPAAIHPAVATPVATPPAVPDASALPMPAAGPTGGAQSPEVATASSLDSAPVPAATGSRRTIAYVVGGVGVGSLIAGGVFGLRARSKLHDSDARCPNNQCTPEGVALNDQAKTAALVSDITVGAGLVSLAVATYLLVTSGKAEPAPAGKLAYRIRVLPEMGPGEAKVTLGGSW